MIDNNSEALNLMVAANVLLAAGALLLIVWARSLLQQLERRFQELEQRQSADATDSALLGFLDHRLSMLDERLQNLQINVAPVVESADPSPESSARPFDYAVRMARQGAGVEDLVRACGLSSTEAELIHRVHGMTSAVTH